MQYVNGLIRIIRYGTFEEIKLFLDQGPIADINYQDPGNGLTALMWAVMRDYTEIVKLLLDMGADPNIRTKLGETALIDASTSGNIDIVQMLLDKEANPNVKDEDGFSPLLQSVKRRHREITKLLLNHGADPDIQDDEGNTVFIISVMYSDDEMIKLLMRKNANPFIQNKSGICAINARYFISKDIRDTIQQYCEIYRAKNNL